jgi:hypothetical protein
VNYLGELPYDMRAILHPIQYKVWKTDDPFEEIGRVVQETIESRETTPQRCTADSEPDPPPAALTTLIALTEGAGAPLPSAEPILESGALRDGSPFYIARPEDSTAHHEALGRGTTTIVKGPRQIGKSSLLARLRAAGVDSGFRVFYLDLEMVEEENLQTLDALLRFLARRLARELNTALKQKDVWDDDEGPKTNLQDFMERAVLTEDQPQLVMFFDEVDRVFGRKDYRDDFFAMIRGWHNLRAQRECWDRLNLVLAHSTEPALWIQDLNQSPFNVVTRLRLKDFDLAQVGELNRRYGSVLKESQLSQLMKSVGGHPFLVRQALFLLVKQQFTLPALLERAADLDGPFGDHLKRLLWCLHHDAPLAASLKQIVNHGQCDNEAHFQRLCAAGLVIGADRRSVALRCDIYRDFLRDHL